MSSHHPAVPPRLPIALAFALSLVAVTASGCFWGRQGVQQEVTLLIDVRNETSPPTDVVVNLHPAWGRRGDRIELGVVRGASEGSFRVTVPADRYRLEVEPLFRADRYVAPLPNAQPRAGFARTDRFTVTPATRRIVWVTRASTVTIEEHEEGGATGS